MGEIIKRGGWISQKAATVVFAVEGQTCRSEVLEMTREELWRRIRNDAMWHVRDRKKVWFYIFDDETTTWTRSPKYRYFNNNLLESDREIRGMRLVPELEIGHVL